MTTPEALQVELNAALARLSEALSQKASLEAALIENHRLASEQINEKHRILTETRGALAAANARADAIELARVVLLADERREKHRADAAEAEVRAWKEGVCQDCAEKEEALAAARRECDLLRDTLTLIAGFPCSGNSYEPVRLARKALTAPAAASGEEGKHGT